MDFNGENSCNSKLTNIEANKIRNIYLSEKISLMNLAKRYNVSERTIGRIIHNETYK
jgi:transcriptional antiterminator